MFCISRLAFLSFTFHWYLHGSNCRNLRNMHAVSTNRIADILHFNDNKQIFHAVLFNIKNYSPEVINIQRREAELNIVLPRGDNFDIKQKKAWNICFIVYYQHQTRSGKLKTNKTQQSSVKTQVSFVKTEMQHI